MGLIPLTIPPGVYKNGTDYMAKGRWLDANLIRWHDDVLQPIGGWRIKSTTASAQPIRGLWAWKDNSNNRYIGAGSHNKLYAYTSAGTQYDITPAGFTSGRADALVSIGYGALTYGDYPYGDPRPDNGTVLEATTWTLDNWGETLVGCSTSDGKIYTWALNTSNVATLIANAPTGCIGLYVSEERFLFALGAGGNPRKVQWSDKEDNTTWTPSATNEAGDLELQTTGVIRCAVRVRGQTLILTNLDAHVASYLGPPFAYGIERVGTSCGVISNKAVAVIDQGAVWMADGKFFMYQGGAPTEIKCDVADHVFSNYNAVQRSKIVAVVNSQFSEIWWFYPSTSSTENDKYVAWNYSNNTWHIGTLGRTAGVDKGTYDQPLYFGSSDKKLYEHEIGTSYDSATPFVESGAIEIGAGDRVMQVTKLIPDEKTAGDVQVIFKSRLYPNGSETDHGTFSMASPTSVRFSGRQVSMKIQQNVAGDWRVGTMRIDAKPGGMR